jgi:thiamine transport system ATP-binding protein
MRLCLDGVRKAYGDTVALGGAESGGTAGPDGGDAPGGVSLDVDHGEFFTLVGPSGCGKTTTLRLVAGFDSPTAGSIRFDGREMGGTPPERRNVGVVFQNYALFPHLSVAENVAYGLRFTEPPDGDTREERVASLLELVDLPDAGPRDPEELSGGQRQRVALARALAPGPDLLLLDEPMSALDARLRERLRLRVKEIQSTLGITTLYVTHDQEEALAVSDRVAVMADGAVEQVGTPREVYRRPATRFVAEFVGDNNVFEGDVRSVRRVGGSDAREGSTAAPEESPVETKGVEGGSDGGFGGDAADGRRERVVTVDIGEATVPVRTSRAVPADSRVTFCVRPERLRILDAEGGTGSTGSSGGSDGGVTLDATVSNAEFLGDATRTYLRWNGRELTVRSRDPLSGTVRVGFDGADAHVVSVESAGE